jgi:Tfp pilus assembly protein PilZ
MAILLIVLVGVYMRLDLALTGDALRKRLPPIMIEHLDFARRINGREWRVKAEKAESEGDVVRGASIDINVSDLRAERSADVSATSGIFDMDAGKMWFYGIAGVVYLNNGSIDIAASRADYDVSDDVWFFSDGISASDDKIHVTGRVGRIDPSGLVSLGKGVYASWKLE